MDSFPRVGGSLHYARSGASESKRTVSVFNPSHDLEYSRNEVVSASTIRFELGEARDETELLVHHHKTTNDDERVFAPGWHTCLEFLSAVVAGGDVDFERRLDELTLRYDKEID